MYQTEKGADMTHSWGTYMVEFEIGERGQDIMLVLDGFCGLRHVWRTRAFLAAFQWEFTASVVVYDSGDLWDGGRGPD